MRGIRLDCPLTIRNAHGAEWLKKTQKEMGVPGTQEQQQMPQQRPQKWGDTWGSSQHEPFYTMHLPYQAPPEPVPHYAWRAKPRLPEMDRGNFITPQQPAALRHQHPAASTTPMVSPVSVGVHSKHAKGPEASSEDDTTSDASADAGGTPCEPPWKKQRTMGSEGWAPNDYYRQPPWKKQRTSDDSCPEPQMKKQRTSDDVAVEQEHPKHVVNDNVWQKGPGGVFFRCSQTSVNSQPPWLTSLLAGEVLPSPLFVFANRYKYIYIYIHIYIYTPQSASVALCISLVKPARQRTARYITRKRPPIRT